ncbi:MAG: glycoside hydrolase family 3 C-terminal domain-containing protein, partial [Alphaproteobacteria bacterium]|nr:glycoside hydrolase family 3 C-terminal domain-containing protein [Alphaproteobacteria bacterium]
AVLAPNLNLARSPLAGRAFEYFSEDPLLAGTLGAAWIGGLQSTGTGAIAKHLVCNDSETMRDSVDVHVDERTLREVYLLPFELAAQAGCAGLMAAYNKVNGAWCSEAAHILNNIVKGEWGFGGVIMSDWFGTHSGADCINAGLDLEMPGPARFMGKKLLEIVKTGEVSTGRAYAAAAAIAQTAHMATRAKATPMPDDKAQALLIEAAAAGMVLLKNEGDILPLTPASVTRIAVIGPNATAPCYQGGTFAKIALAPDTPTPLDALRAAYGGQCAVIYEPGVDPQPRLPAMPVTPARDLGDGCTRGMTVEYFGLPDCAGAPCFAETRDTNSLVWFAGQHKQGVFDAPGSIRASGRFRASADGDHLLYLGSTGEAQLLVDGTPVLRAGQMPEAKDVMGILKRGDALSVALPLKEGQVVSICVEFNYTGARCQGLWYGVRAPDSPQAMLDRAVDAARTADAVILCVGETSDSSVESKDRPDTKLPEAQLALVDAVLAANPRTIVIANVGHAFEAHFAQNCAALLVVWYPGQGYAPALADVLTGASEPGGRLPVSLVQDEADYPGLNVVPDSTGKLAYAEGVGIGYRGMIAANAFVRYPFGVGEGYARFEWRDVVADGATIAMTVCNISTRAGSDVIQLYRDAPEPALIGYTKIHLAAGEARRIEIMPEPRLLRRWTPNGWQALASTLEWRVAHHAQDRGIRLARSS